ncbi:winged helix-turn-helix domain-containing protein [Falsirhodobacter halotolerans]|uniref:winged helix-turn-helix domain-containing protein n=1 Tax=Falsirhodobacter halotolerans TaxID=1146892 RepID=UPI001FD597CE|nr:winged helix-turn-helix domain-containing protein [Falsirhodobacter halotolerans]MCJ8138417.1 winged helix-turn-helix domain-containing protein [Falsirhodobacter halotolerans]
MTPRECGPIRGAKVSEAEFRRMWNDPNLTMTEIGRRLGISRHAVAVRAHWRKLPPRGNIAAHLAQSIRDPEFAAMWTAGVRYGDLIKHYGVAFATPAKTAARLGLPKRGKNRRSAIGIDEYRQMKIGRDMAAQAAREVAERAARERQQARSS